MATGVKRTYTDLKGVDFLQEASLVDLSRSPDALNVWKNYEDTQGACIETRPGFKRIAEIGAIINGIYIYDKTTAIIHADTTLYKWNNFPSTPDITNIIELYTDMNNKKSYFNKFSDKLYINDGKTYLVYNGTTVKKVTDDTPFIPTTTIGRKAGGIGGGELLQDVNVLTPKRINSFLADGENKEFYLDATGIDATTVTATVNDVAKKEKTDFTVDRATGKVTFNTAPAKPLLSGQDNVFITFSKTVSGYADRINKCTKAILWDNRIFYTGNPDYPNALFHSELNNPQYISDLSYYEDGSSDSAITGMTTGSNVLWVFKNLDQNNANVFVHQKTIDDETGKLYPSQQANVSVGCYVSAINFQDDILYLSKQGLEGISTQNLDSRQIISHRSSLIDSKMVNDSNYSEANMVIWQGYLCILVSGKIYLADSRQKYATINGFEYEWFYWDIKSINPTILKEYDGKLYIGTQNGFIYVFEGTNDNGEVIESYWTTPLDNFGYDNQVKTTNKRGGIAKIKTIPNGKIKIARKTDKKYEYKFTTEKSATGFDFANIDFSNFSFTTLNQSYIIYKIKEKKINELSLKFYSDELDKPFGLYSAVIEAFAGGYIKK